MSATDITKKINDDEIKFVDDGFFKYGKVFDSSLVAGWKGINVSDMILSEVD